MLKKLQNEDYSFDLLTGKLLKSSKRLDFSFGAGVSKLFFDLQTFKNSLFDFEKRPLGTKFKCSSDERSSTIDCLLYLDGEYLEVRVWFWTDQIQQQLKGYLFLKEDKREHNINWETLLYNLESFPNPFLILDLKLENILLANRKLLELISLPFEDFRQGLNLSDFLENKEKINELLNWVQSDDENFTKILGLNIGDKFPNFFRVEMVKVKIEEKEYISTNLILVEEIIDVQKKLEKANELLINLVETQKKFLVSDDFDEPFKDLLEIFIQQTGAEMGFIGRVNTERKFKLKLDAVTDFSRQSKASRGLFNSFKQRGFLFEHPDNFIEDCILSQELLIINDFPTGRKIETEIQGHPKMKNFLGIPVLKGSEVIGLIGLANKKEDFNCEDVAVLKPVISFYTSLIQVIQVKEGEIAARKELEDKEFLLTTTLGKTNDLIFILTEDFAVEYFSPGLKKIFGEDAENEIIVLAKRIFRSKSIKGKSQIKVLENYHVNDQNVWLDLSLDIIREENGNAVRVLGIAKDISEIINYQKKLEQSLQKEKDSSEFKSQFLSIVSHEFKTPLTIIKSSLNIMDIYVKSIVEPRDIQHKVSNKIEKIEKEIDMLNRLVNEILQIEQIDAGKFSLKKKRFHLNSFVENVIDKFKLGKNVNFKSSVGEIYEVYWDPILIECVLENLIENAVKYGGGKPFNLSLDIENNTVHIKVQDFGIGIHENDIDHIFKPFYRSALVGNIKGTGFGLVAVEKFVFQHGGKIKVESKKGKGATFTVII